MNEIRIQKIDGVEFVTYKDYLRLKEIAHDELKELKAASETVKELEEENENLNKQIEQFKKGVKAGTNIIERLEEENKKLKEILNKIIKHETSMGKELFNEYIKISSTNDEKKGDVSILKALKEEGFLNDSINQNDPNGSD